MATRHKTCCVVKITLLEKKKTAAEKSASGGIAVAGGKRVLSNNANVPDIYGNWYSSHREDFGKNLPNTFAEYKRMMYNQGKSKELKEIKEKIKVIENTPLRTYSEKNITLYVRRREKAL